MIDISTLTADQKKELLAQLEYENRPARQQLSDVEVEFWGLLHEALGVPLKRAMPLARFLENYPRAKYAEMAEYVRYFCEAGCSPTVRKVQLMSVMEVVLRCLISHLTVRQIPATPAVMCNSIAVLEYAVEKRFPGYRAARLLDRVSLRG